MKPKSQVININIEDFLKKFNQEYEFLYESDRTSSYVAGYDEAVDAFDEFLKTHGDFVGKFSKFRGDYVSSDREAAAFMFALTDLVRNEAELIFV